MLLGELPSFAARQAARKFRAVVQYSPAWIVKIQQGRTEATVCPQLLHSRQSRLAGNRDWRSRPRYLTVYSFEGIR